MNADLNAPTSPAPEEDVTTALYRAAIGPVNTGYYLPIFVRFEAADHAGISWNTAASLATLNWLAFRQLWGAALAYVGALVAILLLVFGIGRLVFQLSDTLVGALLLGFGLAAFVLPGLFGNAVLHTDCRKRMAKALVAHSNVTDACAALTRQASTRRRAIVLAAANGVALIAALVIYLLVAKLGNLAVMPHGALETGQIAVSGVVDNTLPITLAPVSAPALPPASAVASAPVPAPAVAPASESASAPVLAPLVTAVTPAAQAVGASQPRAPASSTSSAKSTDAVVVKAPAEPSKPKQASVPEKKSSQAATPKPKPQRAASAPAVAASADKSYFINVGLFAKPTNATNAHAKLLEAQLPSVTKEMKSAKGPVTRVRVGPFASQQDALDAAVKIQGLQLDAVLVQP